MVPAHNQESALESFTEAFTRELLDVNRDKKISQPMEKRGRAGTEEMAVNTQGFLQTGRLVPHESSHHWRRTASESTKVYRESTVMATTCTT